jgi:hypothetical protein
MFFGRFSCFFQLPAIHRLADAPLTVFCHFFTHFGWFSLVLAIIEQIWCLFAFLEQVTRSDWSWLNLVIRS